MEIAEKVEVAAQIIGKYETLVRAIIRLHADNDYDADDIFQDFFLSLVNKPIPLPPRDMKAYLSKAALNDAFDAIRRRKNYRQHLTQYYQSSKYRSNTQGTPQSIMLNAEETQKAFDLVKERLATREAEAILQKYRYSHNTSEAAEEMGINKRTFDHYVCVGMKKLSEFVSRKESLETI
jgi:RNA polymerase sigma factor (sigma-70 family)